jgi:hypothetical protein
MKTLCFVSLFFQPVREILGPVALPAENRCLGDRIKSFYRGFVSCAEGRSRTGERGLNASLANPISITTPNGPWIYTVVPWED